MSITVIVGPAAVRAGRYWVAVLSGNVWLPRRFRTGEKALAYAARISAKRVKADG